MTKTYTHEDVKKVVDALDDADGWVKTMEAYEASAMLQALYLENAELKAKAIAIEAAREVAVEIAALYALELDRVNATLVTSEQNV